CSSGYTSVVALINHTSVPDSDLAEAWKNDNVPRIILSKRISFSKNLQFIRQLIVEALKLRRKAKKSVSGTLLQRIFIRASQGALSGQTLSNLIMAFQIENLAKNLQPKAIVVTHEGHAWERMAFAAVRRVNPDTRCIGFQHSAIFKLQHAIRRNLAPEYNPDLILSSGEVGKKQLEAAPGLKNIPVDILGSNRIFERGKISEKNDSQQPLSCLVLPEGDINECNLLFEFSRHCAFKLPQVKFIWRLHPLLTFAKIFKQNPILRNLPDNIELSTSSIQEDIMRSKWALYRGTTAIIQAGQCGLRPIYLHLPNEMTIDPLYELSGWREIITKSSELVNIIQTDIINSFEGNKAERVRTIEYCQNFFVPFDYQVLQNCITNVDLSQ
ncbi:MAG: hypothetical protein HQK65_13520, partial [Desulfamplus sp.]|nr:hypothetical protein [Desulfamplus sp.]